METKYSLVGTLILPNCLVFSCIRATLSCVLFNQQAGKRRRAQPRVLFPISQFVFGLFARSGKSKVVLQVALREECGVGGC